MNPYSHLVIASKLEAQIRPENPAEYYWGAVAPDVRYPARMQRDRTHLPQTEILGLMQRHPELESFLQGYLVHCLADEIELGDIFFLHLPFSLFKNQMTRQQMAVSLELYYFENEKLDAIISTAYNQVLQGLGLDQAVCETFAQAVQHYATGSTQKTRFMELFQMLGLENDARLRKYWAAARSFQRNPLLISVVFFGLRSAKISEQIVSATAELLAKTGI